MAEIGTAAAAAQFIGYGAKALLATVQLYQQLRDAPKNAQKHRSSIQKLFVLIERINSDLESAGPGQLHSLISPKDLDDGLALVQECLSRANLLMATLNDLITLPGEKLVKKGVKAVQSVKREKAIAGQLRDLSQLADSLDLWYSHQNLRLAQQQIVCSSMTLARVDSLHRRVESGFTEMEGALARNSVLASRATIQAISQAVVQGIQQNRITPHSQSSTHPTSQYTNGHNALLPQEMMEEESRAVCTCRMRSKKSGLGILASINALGIIYQSEVHNEDCPYRQTPRTMKCGYRFRTSWPYVANISLMIQLQTGGGIFRICPEVIMTGTVDRFTSPGFVAIAEAVRVFRGLDHPEMDDGGFIIPEWYVDISQVKTALDTLYRSLKHCFTAKLVSAHDQDIHGNTLLHEFVRYSYLLINVEEEVHDQTSKIINFLVESGVDIHATTLSSYDFVASSKSSCNALDFYLGARHYRALFEDKDHFKDSRIDRLLLKLGAESAGPAWYRGSPWEIGVIQNNPEIAVDHGYSAVILAVTERNEQQLRRLIAQNADVESDPRTSHSPLSFAIRWPTGMRILLDAGADPSTAYVAAIRYRDVDSIEMLLQYVSRRVQDASHEENLDWYSKDLLQLFLGQINGDPDGESENSAIFDQILRSIVSSRLQLSKLALSHMTNQELIEAGWNGSQEVTSLLDASALQILKCLKQKGVPVPRAALPGSRYRTVYHLDYMTTAVAERLFEAGFHELDVEDDQGWTPLLRSCKYTGSSVFEDGFLPLWYLEHGVRPRGTQRFAEQQYLHLLAVKQRRCFHSGRYPRHRLMVQRFAGFLDPLSEDVCECACSSSGCLPSQILIRDYASAKLPGGWPEKIEMLWDWLNCLHQENFFEKRKVIFFEACRLELFERLGMTHTCCDDEGDQLKIDEERDEIRDEESGFIEHLDSWMEIYQRLEHIWGGGFEIFWEVWWDTLAKFVPERRWTWSDDLIRFVRPDPDEIGGSLEYGPDEEKVRMEFEVLMGIAVQQREGWTEFADSVLEVFQE